ncbi:PDZ domain-containing protein [Candidatus Microgenomates bacterium]|nr:MAG: PDZ domain-containing protein [Candidatus Microgenomates bacterium]
MLITALLFLVLLSVLVLIHELGHFFVAKKLGIKVEEFGFGIPPRAFGIKRGETIYSINWLPIGGFVKLYGEDEAGSGKIGIKKQESRIKDEKRAFFSRPVWQRALVIVAGVAMNALLAIIIFYAFLFISNFKVQLPLISDHKFFGVNQVNSSDIIISGVAKNSPAEKAGITPFSKVTKINGQKVTDIKLFVNLVSQNKGKEVLIEWEDAKTNKKSEARLIPRVSPPKNEGALGVAFFPITMTTLNYQTPLQKTLSGVTHPLNLLSYNFDVMGKLIGISIKEKNAAPLGDSVSGPVGIYSLVGSIGKIVDVKERVLEYLNLAGILSISLAFFNILPIPALDGGRLFFILIEGFTGKKVPARVEGYIHAIGMALLLGLIAVITFHDVARIFSGKSLFGP